ncbi:hypothetical protein SBOR_2967 [Sclerotinia borealis F-4128]|uniref:Uncharacterized protein n=1 Tax=Sclerotinia borealis (strain F-4128) TaxID=1432307 RepID=W9CIS0_SCLBF|nr:hypothetical protein SBOR_2967 [Sclerotinia borealis F-4128]
MIMLIFLLIWGLLSGLAAAAASTDIDAKFFYLLLDSDSTITKLRSVQVVPPSSTAPVIPGNVQAIWPALQNNEGIIQTAVANQGSIGEWFYIGLEYCCTPEDWKADKAQQVYPGDRITTQYELTSANTGVYNVTWRVERGHAGIKASEKDFSAESVFNPREHQASPGQGPFTKANTTRSDWCYRPTNNTDFEYYLDAPTVYISSSQVICKYSFLILGDTTPPTSPSFHPTTSHIDPGLTTQVFLLSFTTSPTPFAHNWNPSLPTPKLEVLELPASTLSNGLPDPSYSAKVASIESSFDSSNSLRMSQYTEILEASLMSAYGTVSITAVDEDNALTTVTADKFNIHQASVDAAILDENGPGILAGNGVGNSTSGDTDDGDDISGRTVAWMVAIICVMALLTFFGGFWLIKRRSVG